MIQTPIDRVASHVHDLEHAVSCLQGPCFIHAMRGNKYKEHSASSAHDADREAVVVPEITSMLGYGSTGRSPAKHGKQGNIFVHMFGVP